MFIFNCGKIEVGVLLLFFGVYVLFWNYELGECFLLGICIVLYVLFVLLLVWDKLFDIIFDIEYVFYIDFIGSDDIVILVLVFLINWWCFVIDDWFCLIFILIIFVFYWKVVY